jgi:hypothetical protein
VLVPGRVVKVVVVVLVATSPVSVAVVAMVTIVLTMVVEGMVTVRVAVVPGVVVVCVVGDVAVAIVESVVEPVDVAVAVPVAGKHSRFVSQGAPPPHAPEDGQSPSNLMHWYGLPSGLTLPPQPKLDTHAKTSWQLQPPGQFSVPVHPYGWQYAPAWLVVALEPAGQDSGGGGTTSALASSETMQATVTAVTSRKLRILIPPSRDYHAGSGSRPSDRNAGHIALELAGSARRASHRRL